MINDAQFWDMVFDILSATAACLMGVICWMWVNMNNRVAEIERDNGRIKEDVSGLSNLMLKSQLEMAQNINQTMLDFRKELFEKLDRLGERFDDKLDRKADKK